MIDSNVTHLLAANKHRALTAMQQVLFTAPTVMKSGLHVKAVDLSDEWFVYPLSIDGIATVALNQ